MSDEMTHEMLTPLIERARKTEMWLWCHYQGLWFSPDELEAENRQGRFLWGAVNWKLRNPQEHIVQLQKSITFAEDELAKFRQRIQRSRPPL